METQPELIESDATVEEIRADLRAYEEQARDVDAEIERLRTHRRDIDTAMVRTKRLLQQAAKRQRQEAARENTPAANAYHQARQDVHILQRRIDQAARQIEKLQHEAVKCREMIAGFDKAGVSSKRSEERRYYERRAESVDQEISQTERQHASDMAARDQLKAELPKLRRQLAA